MASTRPTRAARLTAAHSSVLWTAYALLMTCGTSVAALNRAMASTCMLWFAVRPAKWSQKRAGLSSSQKGGTAACGCWDADHHAWIMRERAERQAEKAGQLDSKGRQCWCAAHDVGAPWSKAVRGSSAGGQRTLSALRGAKQLVVVTRHATVSQPRSAIFRSNAATSVTRESPSCFGSMTTGIRLAAVIAFMHVFWSMRLMSTLLHAAAALEFYRRLRWRCAGGVQAQKTSRCAGALQALDRPSEGAVQVLYRRRTGPLKGLSRCSTGAGVAGQACQAAGRSTQH